MRLRPCELGGLRHEGNALVALLDTVVDGFGDNRCPQLELIQAPPEIAHPVGSILKRLGRFGEGLFKLPDDVLVLHSGSAMPLGEVGEVEECLQAGEDCGGTLMSPTMILTDASIVAPSEANTEVPTTAEKTMAGTPSQYRYRS